MDINIHKRYVLKKDYSTNQGVIPANSEITFFHGCAYINGGLCPPGYQAMFEEMVDNNSFRNEYLKEIEIINNKI